MMQPNLPAEHVKRLRNRRALLWLCQRHELVTEAEVHGSETDPADVRARYRQTPSELDLRLASIHWEAIWSESVKGLLADAVRRRLAVASAQTASAVRNPVILPANPDSQGQLDTRELLPIYFINGLLDEPHEGAYLGRYSMQRQLFKLSQLRKLGDFPNRLLVVIGAEFEKDLQDVADAISDFAPIGCQVLVVWPEGAPLPKMITKVPLSWWVGTLTELLDYLEEIHAPKADALARLSIRIGERSLALEETDLFGIQDRFDLILEKHLNSPDPSKVNRTMFEDFVKGVESRWSAYAAGLPFSRHYHPVEDDERDLTTFVLDELGKLAQPSRDIPNITLTVPVQTGAGTTTLLSKTAYEVAEQGYPVIMLLQDQVGFNVDAINAFLGRLSQKLQTELSSVESVPTLLVFDTNHEYVTETYSVAQKLGALGRNVVVLRAEALHTGSSNGTSPLGVASPLRVRGAKKLLAPLESGISRTELEALHRHFTKLADRYPLGLEAPTLDEWRRFQNEQTFRGHGVEEDADNLFWVALYFFLLSDKAHDAVDGFDGWIQKAYDGVENHTMRDALVRIAALSSFRLLTPLTPLLRSLGQTAFSIDTDMILDLANLDEETGLVTWHSTPEDLDDQALRFRHPLVAGRLLRYTHESLALFPVRLVWPILQNLRGGSKADIWLAESLTFYVLRTERRGWSRIPNLKDRLDTFEIIPSHISEYSKAVLHHWARALYHSVLDSRDESSAEADDLRLQAAIEKLTRAIQLPPRLERDEHPSHLYTTLGTTYFELFKRRTLRGVEPFQGADWQRASESFEKALSAMPDNFQALVGYGLRLVEYAESIVERNGDEASRQALQTLSYLEQAEHVADQPGEITEDDRRYLTQLRIRAWRMIDPQAADDSIDELIANRQEVGYFLEARLILRDVELVDPLRRHDIKKVHSAIEVLNKGERDVETQLSWRTYYFMYRLYTLHPDLRFSFRRRLDILRRLERTDFAWHLRMRFDLAVLCYQTGEFLEGRRRFQDLRSLMRQPEQPTKRMYDFWRNPSNPSRPKEATLRILRKDTDWRGYGYVDELEQEVLFRPRHFPVPPKAGDFVRCVVRFETNGPIAVPPHFELITG